MPWERYDRITWVLCIGAALVVPILNLLVDPYDVFDTGLLRSGSTLNERVVKTRHVLKRQLAYDVMIVGSSVAGVINPALLAGEGSAYNFSYFSATPGDILKTLEMLERFDRLPRRLYVALDPFMFTRPVPHAPQMRLPPEASGEPAWNFWRDYVFAGSLSALISKLSEQLAGAPAVAFNPLDGSYALPNHEHAVVRDPAAYVGAHVDSPHIPLARGWWHRPAEKDLERLVAWIEARPQIDVTWFLQPLHRRMHAALGADGPLYLAKTQAIVGPALLDLSNHPIGSDSALWWDVKHYRPRAAELIAANVATAARRAAPAHRTLARLPSAR